MIQISLSEKLWTEIFMISIFLINISSISTLLYSELIENDDCKAVISYEVWISTLFNVQCDIYIIESDIYIHKKESELNFVSKLASCAKKIILVKFRNFIIYWVYDWEKNKIHVSCSVEINKKLMKKNESILTLNKKSDTQEFFDTEKLFIECSTESSIIFSDRNENFNFLFDELVLKTVKSSKQSKKRSWFWKNSLFENKIISTIDDQILNSAARKMIQLCWKKSIVALSFQNFNQSDISLICVLLVKMNKKLLFEDLKDWEIWYVSFHDFKVFSVTHSSEFTYVNDMKISISYVQIIASLESFQWHQIMNEEIVNIHERNVYTLVLSLKKKKSLDSKWIYKIKTNQNDNAAKFKVRWIV